MPLENCVNCQLSGLASSAAVLQCNTRVYRVQNQVPKAPSAPLGLVAPHSAASCSQSVDQSWSLPPLSSANPTQQAECICLGMHVTLSHDTQQAGPLQCPFLSSRHACMHVSQVSRIMCAHLLSCHATQEFRAQEPGPSPCLKPRPLNLRQHCKE
jgi:hypothetical protein